MHLAINAIGIKHSGGATVLLDFLDHVIENTQITKISVFCSPKTQRTFDLPNSQKCHEIECASAEASYVSRLYWMQVSIGKQCELLAVDCLFCMVGVANSSDSIPQITLIQQALPFAINSLPNLSLRQRLRLVVMKQMMKRACENAIKVFVQTPTMEQWVRKDFRLGLNTVEVIEPTPKIPQTTIQMFKRFEPMGFSPNGKRLLYVGSDSPHKNLDMLMKSFKLLAQCIEDATLFLTLPKTHPINQVEGVVCIGYLFGKDLWRAYQTSTLLIMPSLVETVGLPMLEAMSVGTPVLAADRPYAHDICGAAALYFDPLSTMSFVNSASQLLNDEEMRNDLINRGYMRVASLQQKKPYQKMVDVILDATPSKKLSDEI